MHILVSRSVLAYTGLRSIHFPVMRYLPFSLLLPDAKPQTRTVWLYSAKSGMGSVGCLSLDTVWGWGWETVSGSSSPNRKDSI
eukprot:1358123-Amorphochlora_amoeboformis.AAC.1